MCFQLFCTRRCGRIKRPAFPAPSDFEGRTFRVKLGCLRREIAKLCLQCCLKIKSQLSSSATRLRRRLRRARCQSAEASANAGRRTIQYSREVAMESRGRSVLDTPLARGMTPELEQRTLHYASSLRTQGPITTGVCWSRSRRPSSQIARPRCMGPRFPAFAKASADWH